MNWVPKRSAWQEMQIRQAKSREFRENNDAVMGAISSNLSSVASYALSEAGNLAAKQAITRLSRVAVEKVQANAQVASDQATRDIIWRNKTV